MLALTRTLNGTATLTGRQGALTGLNVEQLLRRLERRPLSAGSEFRSGRTPFETLLVALRITNGTAAVEATSLEGATVKVALAGSASIPSRDLSLKGTASLVAATATDGRAPFELPFVVQGPLDDPLMLPDPEILIRRSGAAAPLLDSVESNQRARAAVKAAIERLTGGKKLTYVPFAGGGAVAVQLVGKHIDSTVNNPIEAVAQWRAGALKPLCVFDSKPLPVTDKIAGVKSWADIPPCKAQGLDIEYLMLRGIFMPAGVPKEAVEY
ncbi:MAG: AsmA-like C-terminal region-containing protein, partial [Pseudorhodoplanes sp.]